MSRGSDELFRGGVTATVWTSDAEQAFRQRERHRATRAVAALARDADDCALLLDALGLDPAEGKTHPQ
ncbi:hypothetical protein JOF41_007329 [Saccharothrix coeruleofusca]|uniref:hypothetical protein n=1 Tax=Saccharothrix coeruleofusca TaxID=33919 RepID=UPI001AE7AB87|nr:hypothetical protein [Saccharothrix coeruleofusca]MBP2341075.1 hypothetical protein [Saccharothrix coeruleofusca]